MRVGLLGLLDDYDEGKGQGIQRYMHEVYSRMKRDKSVQLEKAGYTKSVYPFGGGLSFLFGNMFADFGSYDIIHNMDQKPLLPMRKGKAIWVNTAHDFQPILAPQYNDTGLKEHVWQPIINYGMGRSLKADYMIARSSMTRDDAISLGYDREKITVISDGVDERYFTASKKVEHGGFVVGYLGAFRKRKNVMLAIEAMKHIDDRKIGLQIWGRQEFEYDSLATAAAADKRIRFRGFAPEEKIVQIYDSLDVFVFPSVFEGFGIPIIEAQARGVPVIVYKSSRIPSEVKKYCFEATDPEHMAQIIENLKAKGYNHNLRKRATAYARTFTWQKEAEETIRVYKKLVNDA
jgi:glycosyltransferase involved in cell wall biosynthesis